MKSMTLLKAMSELEPQDIDAAMKAGAGGRAAGQDFDGEEMLKKIERVARTCYKSEGKIKDGSARKMVAGLIKSGHDAMLEHASVTVKFVVDRGISHELVRHRMASFAQESTRYCNYIKDDFGSEITFIIPKYLDGESAAYDAWKSVMEYCEDAYFYLLNIGFMPQEARAVPAPRCFSSVMKTLPTAPNIFSTFSPPPILSHAGARKVTP